MKKKLPIGISNFKEIIEDEYYYFDKTEFIENLFEEVSKIKLFTRPRRFGKTLNMSMIKYFFDIENKNENKKLFENLKISENEYFEKQGTAPVISISFRNYDESSWENGFEMIKNTISDLYDEFEFVKENLSARKKEKYDSILFNRATEATWKLSLLDLTKYLYEYYGQKVVVLIDEYDQPIIDSYVKGYYQEAISFFKTFYGVVLKDNNYLEMGIMTGILRVAKENIFSGLNNLRVHTILDNRFTEYFGITESEVEKVLKDFNLEFELQDVQKWYNGYLFGDIKVYNPWSIINFLNDEKLKPYWVNTSGNELIKLYLKKLKNEIFDDFSKLLNREEIYKRINENMTFSNLESNYSKNIWNLFFHSGYLTLGKKIEDDGMCYLKIPNEEILKMFSEMFIEIYFEDYEKFLYMSNALREGNISDFEKYLKDIYPVLMEGYKDFCGFKKISEEDFIKLYSPLKMVIDPDVVFLAYKENILKGFLICLPDYGNLLCKPRTPALLLNVMSVKSKAKRYVLLYMGVEKDCLGLGSALSQMVVDKLREKKASGISALIHTGKATGGYFKDKIKTQRKYVLLEKMI